MRTRFRGFGCRDWLKDSGRAAGQTLQMSRIFSESKKEERLLRTKADKNVRVPLKEVVADCERRWFEETLKAAKSGDAASQSLVGQMFCSGYGVTSDKKKGKSWLRRSAEADEHVRKSLADLSVFRDAPGTGLSRPHPTGT